MKKILIIGLGNMGQWFAENLAKENKVFILEKKQPKNPPPDLKYAQNPEEISHFNPDLVINAVSLDHTTDAFERILPYVSQNTIISDIASIKQPVQNYYERKGFRFVSTHPLFGPTFGDMKNPNDESAILIEGSDEEGLEFFKQFYHSNALKLYSMSFEEHDQHMAITLGQPFLSTFLFGSESKTALPSGTSYKRHHQILNGLLSEDNSLLAEILLNKHILPHITHMKNVLEHFYTLIQQKDREGIDQYLYDLRANRSLDKSKGV